jgi:hypothetical protein
MNANAIINEEMSLDEKLAAIDAAMAAAMASASDDAQSPATGKLATAAAAPVDPADMFMCVGCQ